MRTPHIKTLAILLALSVAACERKETPPAAAETAKAPAPAAEEPAHPFPPGSPKFLTNYQAALDQAKLESKPAVLVFSAVWCGPCQAMKKDVYPSKEVTPLHEKFVWAYLDVDQEADATAAQKYGVQAIPHVQFLDSSGKDLGNQIGGTTSGEFAGMLNTVLKKAAK